MTRERQSGPCRGAADAEQTHADDTLPWHGSGTWRDQSDWWTDPALAYAAGVADGVELGRDLENAALVAALSSALSGGQTTDYPDAVRIHHRLLDQRARRAAFDRGEVAA